MKGLVIKKVISFRTGRRTSEQVAGEGVFTPPEGWSVTKVRKHLRVFVDERGVARAIVNTMYGQELLILV